MPWYKDWFGEDYLKVYPHRDEVEASQQVDFVERILPLSRSQQLLDLGCGSGRHAFELAQRGYHVTCLDLSSVLLNLAKQRFLSQNYCRQLVQADMRYIPFSAVFDAVLSFFTTFGYFKSDAENLLTLKSMAAVLKPGGMFFLDYINKEQVIENLVPVDEMKRDGFEIIQERFYNRKEERIDKKITLKENSELREYYESVRLYTLNEMETLLTKASLRLEKTFGDFDGRPFSNASPRLIMVGKRGEIL